MKSEEVKQFLKFYWRVSFLDSEDEIWIENYLKMKGEVLEIAKDIRLNKFNIYSIPKILLNAEISKQKKDQLDKRLKDLYMDASFIPLIKFTSNNVEAKKSFASSYKKMKYMLLGLPRNYSDHQSDSENQLCKVFVDLKEYEKVEACALQIRIWRQRIPSLSSQKKKGLQLLMQILDILTEIKAGMVKEELKSDLGEFRFRLKTASPKKKRTF